MQWLLAAGFAAAALQPGGAGAERFGALLQLEFLAVHAGLLFGFTAFWHPEPRSSRALRVIALGVFALFYAVAGHAVDGWVGVVGVAGMIVGTHGGLLWGAAGARHRRALEIAVRWLVSFALLMAGIAWADPADGDLGRWTRSGEALWFGAAFFAVLGLVEASGIHRRIRAAPA